MWLMRAPLWLFLTISVAFVQKPLDAQALSSITPSAVTAGEGGFQLIASGTGFAIGAAIQWNGASLSTTYVTAYTLTAYVPATLVATPGTAAVTVLNNGRQSWPLPFAIVSFPGPIIASLAPNTTQPGYSQPMRIDIYGNGFVPGSIAQWGGAALPTTFVSAAQLTAMVPPSLDASAGSYNVTVVNPDGATSPPAVFVLSTALTSLQLIPPTIAAGGPAFSLDLIALNGNFSSTSVVQWNGSPLATTFFSGYELTAAVPASLIAAAGSVTVTITNGYPCNPETFQIVAATLISGLSPSSAAAGGPDLPLTVNGSGFVPGSTVLWNGSSLATTFVSANQLTAVVPASLIASPGTASLTLQMPAGSLLGPYPLTVSAAAPVISSVNSDTTAVAGGPGVTLNIIGTGFLPADIVLWSGSLLSTAYVSPTHLSAAVPASMLVSPGTVSITVQSPSGNSNAVSYKVWAPPPTVSSLSPASAEASGPTFTLTINGTGFQNGAFAFWGGVSRLPSTFISSTQLSVSVAAALIASPQTVTLVVTNPDGQQTPQFSFSITGTPVPVISTNVFPTAAAGGPAFTLPIAGNNVVAGAVVQWNGAPLATTYISGNALNAAVPAALIASPGTASITVVNPGGKTSTAVTLTISPPHIGYLVTTSAPAGSPAISLRVAGNTFVTGSTVYWNGTALATTWESDSWLWLTASVPANLLVTPGTANVTVVNPGNITSNSVPFTIQAPSITSLSPQSDSAGGPAFTLTVSGGYFYSGSAVQWNGSALPTTYFSSLALTASVSASLIATPGTASITVLIPGGAVTNAATFTIQPGALAIASLNPSYVAAGGPSFALAVNGSGFVPGSTIFWKSPAPSTTYALNT